MKILVITPTLGRSPWLDETVSSVARRPVTYRHVLVCPAAVQAELEKRFPSALVVPEPGGGMYAAINAGLAALPDWEACTYLNDDDILLPNFDAVVRALAGAASQPLIVYGGVRLINAAGRRLGAIPVSPDPALNRALYALRLEPVYQHGTLISRAAMERLGGFDAGLRFCGDSDFLARACLQGIPFAKVAGGAVAAFRLHPGQLTRNRPAMLAERAQVDAKLGLLAPPPALRRGWARFVFRAANLPLYVERVARHGWVTFDELLAQT